MDHFIFFILIIILVLSGLCDSAYGDSEINCNISRTHQIRTCSSQLKKYDPLVFKEFNKYLFKHLFN